jgi:hypothetical protein
VQRSAAGSSGHCQLHACNGKSGPAMLAMSSATSAACGSTLSCDLASGTSVLCKEPAAEACCI